MTDKETAEELRKKANELLALADKISPQIQETGISADSKSKRPANPNRKPDWLDKQSEELKQLGKSKQLSGG